MSTGNTFTALQYEFKISKNTIALIVKETCQVIWMCLKNKEMPQPKEEQWYEIAEQFYVKTDFPNCVGAVDGKHVRCVKPRNSGSKFYNYKKIFSIVLMAVADANLRFIAINVGAYGQEGDSTIFRDSPLGKKMYSGTLNLPPPRFLPGTNSDPQPFVMVGDEAFRLHSNLLRPFPQRNIDYRRRIYNYRLSRCRRTVECAFGVLANKWRIFHTPIMVNPDFADDIIKACCVLHNFVRERDGVNFDGTTSHPFTHFTNVGPTRRELGVETRNSFADYFLGAGAVPFQDRYA